MYNFNENYTYHIPVNAGVSEDGTDESITLERVQIIGSPPRRLVLLRKFLAHKYSLTRSEASKAIVAMGFTDLIPEQVPCMS